MIISPPAHLVQGYYTKAIEHNGIYLLGGPQVSEYAMYTAAETVFNLLRYRSDITATLAQNNGRYALAPVGGVATDLPEFAYLSTNTSYAGVIGLGGTLAIPVSSSSEDNVLKLSSDPYSGQQNILLHEAAHLIENVGFTPSLRAELTAAYNNAKASGVWNNTYAITNEDEYFAEISEAYFGHSRPPDAVKNSINTREELATSDPLAYSLAKKMYGNDSWNDGDWIGGSSTDHLVGFDSNDFMVGWDGNDRLEGGAGNDKLIGGRGDDRLDGGRGGDVLFGGPGSDTLIGDGVVTWDNTAASVRRLYIATLDRGPDDGGLQNWTNSLNAGQSLNSIVSGFINSTEFSNVYGALSNTAFVTTLYNNVLNRAPDTAGLNSWVSQLNSGTSRETVVLGFSESAEFKITSEIRSISGQVFRMYDSAFNRTADAGGFAGWWDSMYGGTSIGEIANAFINSAEFTATYGAIGSLTNTQYVQQLYLNVLNRAAESGGLSYWVNELANGMTRSNLLVTFSESTEHMNLMATGLDSFMRNNLADWRDVLVGESGVNHLTGHRGSDMFTVTAGDAGTHYVYGLESFDALRLVGFGYSNSGQALAAMSQSGGDVLFTAGGTTIRFVDTQLSTLQNLGSAGWVLS